MISGETSLLKSKWSVKLWREGGRGHEKTHLLRLKKITIIYNLNLVINTSSFFLQNI